MINFYEQPHPRNNAQFLLIFKKRMPAWNSPLPKHPSKGAASRAMVTPQTGQPWAQQEVCTPKFPPSQSHSCSRTTNQNPSTLLCYPSPAQGTATKTFPNGDILKATIKDCALANFTFSLKPCVFPMHFPTAQQREDCKHWTKQHPTSGNSSHPGSSAPRLCPSRKHHWERCFNTKRIFLHKKSHGKILKAQQSV